MIKMNMVLRVMLMVLAILNITACLERNNDSSYNYLLLHPRELKHEMASCQDEVTATGKIPPHCEVVIKAADQMLALAEDQQKHPEKFGQKILRAQMDYATSPTPENRDKVNVLLLVVGLSSPE